MRRQFGVGGVQPVGSSCMLQLDPQTLPVSFETRDNRADGGVRHIEINRERVVVRRAVGGIRMAINVRVSEFIGIACRQTDDGRALVLVHHDPSLSVPLLVSDDELQINLAWQMWGDLFALPPIENENGGIGEAAPRRRRRNIIKDRRPKFLVRRKAGRPSAQPSMYRGEREIIARN